VVRGPNNIALCAVGAVAWPLRHVPWTVDREAWPVDALTLDPAARPLDHGPCTLALEPPKKEDVSCGCIISLYYNVNMVTASMRCGSRFEVRRPLIHGLTTQRPALRQRGCGGAWGRWMDGCARVGSLRIYRLSGGGERALELGAWGLGLGGCTFDLGA
jgi:hypothetical protein